MPLGHPRPKPLHCSEAVVWLGFRLRFEGPDVQMTDLQQPPASWGCLPRVTMGGLVSLGGIAPWIPLFPESVETQPQQDEA